MKTTRFTTVLWDVDGTLLDFLYSQRCAITRAFHSVGREITQEQIERYSQINESFWKRHERGEVEREELLTGRFLQLFDEYGMEGIDLPAFLQEFQDALGSVFLHRDDSLAVCRFLAGYVRQYVVTNGVTATQTKKLKLSGLWDLMDGVFISEEIGKPKPSSFFFESCLSRVEEKDRRKILIVGDSLSSDIKGGKEAGIATCWYRPDGSVNPTGLKPDYEISDLHMIYDILGVFDRWQSPQGRS